MGTSSDTLIVGAPGRSLSHPLVFRVLDGYGRPLPGAAVSWRVTSGSGQLGRVDSVAAGDGSVQARWTLGTNAADAQRVDVTASVGNHAAATVAVTAAAVPVEVASLAIAAETTDVHLGAPILLQAEATDPFGNRFVPTTLRFASLDTGLAHVDSTGLLSAQRRGYVRVVATANGVQDSAWVHAVQTVQAIVVDRDTLRFHALGQAESLHVALVDDHALPVTDSLPSIVAADSTLVAVRPGAPVVIQSLANGSSVLRLAAGSITRNVSLTVRQRTASLSFAAGAFVFDALSDTARATLIALDSLGVPVQMPRITLASADTQVVTIDSAGVVTARGNGSAVLSALSVSGVVATVPVTVAQRVAAIRLLTDTARFDALNDTVGSGPVAFDPLGSVVEVPDLVLASRDTSIAVIDPAGLITARGNGTVVATIRAPSGITATIQVAVAQRVAAVTVARDSLRFEALHAVFPVDAVARDRLGSPVAGAIPVYASSDTSVITVDGSGAARAVANGTATLLAVADPDTARVSIVVSQRPTMVRVAKDTLRFDALGETDTISAVALDSLGSSVAGGIEGVVIDDTCVARNVSATTIEARGNGTTLARVTVVGVVGQVVAVVRQVPTKVTAALTFPNAVLTLPVGSTLPITCQTFDRNGFLTPVDPDLVVSGRGTVSGLTCGSARVQSSGYDTLDFAVGSVQTRVPVIVSTASDSVGTIVAAQPLTSVARDSFVGENLANPLILALRPLVADILAAYGNPTTNLDRARALRDWVSRTAVHPFRQLHSDGSSANLSVLPPGTGWADVNAVSIGKVDQDTPFWGAVGLNGYAMLDSLLGTLDPATGQRADNGLMVHIAGARYQIRDINTYRYVLCSYEDIMLNALWAAAGLHGMLISTVGHDPAAVFIPELGRWIYEDPEWDEEYVLDGAGDPLSPTDLLTLSSAGQGARLQPVKLAGPSFDPETYVAGDSYVGEDHPDGMVIMGSQLNNRVVGIVGAFSWPLRYVQIDVPRLSLEAPFNDPGTYDRVSAQEAFPTLGVVVQELQAEDSVFVTHLSSTLPDVQQFQRRVQGAGWESVGVADVLPVGQCRVEYRSVDAAGNISGTTVLDLWIPRGKGFLEAGTLGSPRERSRYCS